MHLPPEVCVDSALYLVKVSLIKTALELLLFTLQPSDFLRTIFLFCFVAGPQSFSDISFLGWANPESADNFCKSISEYLFSNVRLFALSCAVGAPTVDVPSFLEFGSDRAATVAASEQSLEGKLPTAGLGFASLAKLCLALTCNHDRRGNLNPTNTTNTATLKKTSN